MELATVKHERSFKTGRPAIALLPLRLILFAVFQLLIAVLIRSVKGRFSFPDAGIYWPFTATAANVVTFILLAVLFKKEGSSVFNLFRIDRTKFGKDLPAAFGILAAVIPVSLIPNILLSNVLLGGQEAVTPLLFGSMPAVAAYFTVLLPLTIPFAEIPLYFGYILPRLSKRLNSTVAAVLITAIFLALQHCTLPLVFDMRYLLWRFGMFLPLALLFAFVINRRPRLMPYMLILHALLDFATTGMIISNAAG